MHEFGTYDGQVNSLLERMPVNGDMQAIISWLIELFEIWREGEDERIMTLRDKIAERLISLYRVQPIFAPLGEPPEGYTLRGRWLFQLAMNTLSRNYSYRGEPLAADCRRFLAHARPWIQLSN